MKRRWLALIGASVLGMGTSAFAQEEDEKGLGVSLVAGLGDYMGGLGAYTSVGPTWGVRVDTAPLSWASVEVAYEGSRNPLVSPLPQAAAWRNGVSALAKLSPLELGVVTPFIGVGLGASFINVNDPAEQPVVNSAGYQNDLVAEVPFAVGVDFAPWRNVEVGARATLRPLLGESFADPVAGRDVNGSLLTASILLGGRF